jgi:C-terminal processing protease CtpA/Prc
MLPIRLASIEGRIVIAASDAAEAAAGAVVSAIDGVPAATRLADAMALTSGTTQWKQSRALQEIATCRKGSVVTLSVDAGGGARDVSLSCAAIRLPAERRPVPIAELSPGIWYVDLTRANLAQVQPMIGRLARATGVVFDVRGYPTDAGARILPHLMEAPEQDRWMHVAKLVGPFGQAAGWQSVGWNLKPVSPRFAGRIVFMTDGGAISYAESVMGYVGDRRLGTIVGSPTAGTNGNVAVFDVPGGFRIAFTGMKVTRHDGRSAHHLVGVRPDIPVEPTLASLRAGRDAVLERAVEAARGQ